MAKHHEPRAHATHAPAGTHGSHTGKHGPYAALLVSTAVSFAVM
jgi:hypothetical protein